VELTSVLRRAVEMVNPYVHQRDQHLDARLDPDSIYVMGDATRLEQAFGNLLHNASKFSERGGLIGIRTSVQHSEPGPQVFVHIRDSGIGIDSATVPLIFDLFRQGAESPHQTSGLGVGLALVRRIVELHGGTVTASSAGSGMGSEFVVGLPMLPNTTTDADTSFERITATSDARRILVVDDNVDAAESLMGLLRLHGHDARMVHDGVAALELAPAFVPSVVFLDIAMPGMDGYEVARRLRRMPEVAEAFLVAVTGLGREEDRRRSEEAGFDRHMTKPLDPKSLPSIISQRDDGAVRG
jgi:two-component system CheB/CheR fusion protein